MTITTLAVHKGNTWKLELDDSGELYFLHVSVVQRCGLQKGMTLTPQQWEQVQTTELARKAYQYACFLLDRRGYSYQEMFRKLEPKYPQSVCYATVDRLAKFGQINDRAYAEQLAHHYVEVKHFGLRRARQEMYRRGLLDEHITEALEPYEDEVTGEYWRNWWRGSTGSIFWIPTTAGRLKRGKLHWYGRGIASARSTPQCRRFWKKWKMWNKDLKQEIWRGIMQTERRIAKCAVLAALLLLGGACTKIDAVRSDGKQTQEAVMAAASAAEVSTTAETTTAATTESTTTTVTTTVTTTTAAGLCQPFIDENANIDPSKPMVALTFDDGPGQYTNSILDTLEAYQAHASFFVVGQNINDETSAVMQRAVGLGCEIGSHTENHADLVKADANTFQQEIQQADDRILQAIGRYPYFLRPPYGDFNDDVRRHVGKPLAFWSVDTKDWKTRNTASTVSATLNNIEDGDVVLMHDIYGETAAAVAQIVPSLVQQGYQLVTLSELTYYRGVEMENGMIVFNMHPANPNYKLPPDPDVPEPQTTPAPETETTTETVAAAGQ